MGEEKEKLLEVKDLYASYGKLQVLNGVSFEVKKSEIVALIGPNGAGKSTTLKAIFGLLKATKGDIRIFDESIAGLEPYEILQKGISLVLQGRRIFPEMTVLENLELGAYIVKDKDIIKNRVDKVFTLFPSLVDRRKDEVGLMSGGEQQMVALGRALMLEPKLLMLDEPSLGLAPKVVEQVFDAIEKINRAGTTLLIVEQNVSMVLEIADRGYVFDVGKIRLHDTGEKLLEDETLTKVYLSE